MVLHEYIISAPRRIRLCIIVMNNVHHLVRTVMFHITLSRNLNSRDDESSRNAMPLLILRQTFLWDIVAAISVVRPTKSGTAPVVRNQMPFVKCDSICIATSLNCTSTWLRIDHQRVIAQLVNSGERRHMVHKKSILHMTTTLINDSNGPTMSDQMMAGV